jgi:hypothetical protein
LSAITAGYGDHYRNNEAQQKSINLPRISAVTSFSHGLTEQQ